MASSAPIRTIFINVLTAADYGNHYCPMRLFQIAVFTLAFLPVRNSDAVAVESIAAKAGAEVQRAIPGSKLEVSGNTALISRDTTRANNIDFKDGHVVAYKPERVDIPKRNGVMFIIRFLAGEPKVYGRAKNPQFDYYHADRHGYYAKSSTFRRFRAANVTMIVDVLFNDFTNQKSIAAGIYRPGAFRRWRLEGLAYSPAWRFAVGFASLISWAG
jgi:hypothetical protein